ncbi:MAG TPA: hypothetical protein VFG79_06870 [Solirubrobacter sp.]|jgi:hypothetical protein|nr:hypothetical protein [Solirubrobacter sp.]
MPEPDPAAYAAAERLVREAHARAEEAARGAGDVPPSGWRGDDAGSPFPDLGALLALVDSARGALPPELMRQLADALRDLLLAIRAVLDYSIERLERPPRGEPTVEDIPIR